MNSLFIDCSAGMNVVVKSSRGEFSAIDNEQKKHTENLLKNVDDLLCKAQIKISDIDVFGVCVGPGSFTGIRVAVSIVKGLAICSNAKICQISNFECYDVPKNSTLVLDGFSDNVYAKFGSGESANSECIQVEELAKKLSKNANEEVYVQSEKTQNLLKKYEISSKIAVYKANFVFEEKIKNSEFVTLDEISPIYLRASQAEIERQKKLVK